MRDYKLLNYLSRGIRSRILYRLLMCLPFIAVVFYLRSYHGTFINNAQVEWQYVRSDEGKVYLALDVYSPSGVKIDGISSRGREITDSWRLINYPDWYKGESNFKSLSKFEDILHPYLPYNSDSTKLYSNSEWYTFLYEWNPTDKKPIPDERTIRIKYKNIGTQNSYWAKHILGPKINTTGINSKIEVFVSGLSAEDFASTSCEELPSGATKVTVEKDRPTFSIPILYPFSYSPGSAKKDSLKCHSHFSECTYEGMKRNDYVLSIQDENGDYIDILKGTVLRDKGKALHVYYKSHTPDGNMGGANAIDYTEVFTHLALTLFMVYFVLICSYVGHVFMKQCDITLNSYTSNFVISAFLGAILLTYLFFVIGTLKLLYFEFVFTILLIGLFLSYGSSMETISNFKVLLINESQKLKEAPQRIVFLILLAGILFYNFSYCFIPATAADASSDIINSYLPLLNDYILSHSFKAAIQNSTIGLNSQATDVLRTVVKMFTGEPGVYLLSFACLLGILGAIYLIGKELFGINSMLIYITLWMFLIANLFVEYLHLGKLHIAVSSCLLISLYSIRFSDHDKNYILIPIFLAFLSSQYPFFIVVPLSFYFFVFGYSFYRGTKASERMLYTKSLILFSLLCTIFYLKLIYEVGICFPAGPLPQWLADLFLKYNHNNELYKYIDNNYIRIFYSTFMQFRLGGIEDLEDIPAIFSAVILLSLLLIRKIDRYAMLYITETMVLVLSFSILCPTSSKLLVYYIFPLFILQIVILDCIVSLTTKCLTAGKKLALLFFLIIILFDFVYNPIHQSILLEFIYNRIHPNKTQYVSTNRLQCGFKVNAWRKNIFAVFTGQRSKYQYLGPGEFPAGAQRYFDHAMLIRDYTDVKDMILILPVRYHSDTNRLMTARHALGSVIYQKDLNKIMADLKRFNINYLSFIPMSGPEGNRDYSPYYTPIFEDEDFKKYFQLLFSDHSKKFYKIIHDGTNTRYSPSPYNVKGLPFIPMLKEDQI